MYVDLRNEIVTVQDLADALKMTRRQIYEMTRTRGKVRPELLRPQNILEKIRKTKADLYRLLRLEDASFSGPFENGVKHSS